jgi:hypothetical protein
VNSCSDAILLCRRLRLEGVSILADGNDIRIIPAGFLTPDDRELLKAHKPAVVAWLRHYATEHCPSNEELRRRGWLPGDHQAP